MAGTYVCTQTKWACSPPLMFAGNSPVSVVPGAGGGQSAARRGLQGNPLGFFMSDAAIDHTAKPRARVQLTFASFTRENF